MPKGRRKKDGAKRTQAQRKKKTSKHQQANSQPEFDPKDCQKMENKDELDGTELNAEPGKECTYCNTGVESKNEKHQSHVQSPSSKQPGRVRVATIDLSPHLTRILLSPTAISHVRRRSRSRTTPNGRVKRRRLKTPSASSRSGHKTPVRSSPSQQLSVAPTPSEKRQLYLEKMLLLSEQERAEWEARKPSSQVASILEAVGLEFSSRMRAQRLKNERFMRRSLSSTPRVIHHSTKKLTVPTSPKLACEARAVKRSQRARDVSDAINDC